LPQAWPRAAERYPSKIAKGKIVTPEQLESEQMVLDSVDRFLEAEVRPNAHRLEQADEYPQEIVDRMKELGLFGCIIDPAYGGIGLSTLTYAKIVERISAVWMSVSGIINSHLIMAAAVQRSGTEAQKRRYLPKFATGELRGGVGLTEPDAGTDLQAIRTVAVRDGDHYVVNGAKTWITNSMYGNTLALLVKTDPQAQPRHKGMSLFIAEKGPGFKVTKKLGKLGYRGIDTCELVFEDYRIPADCLIGGVEGRGLQQVLSGLELGRINVAARGVGVARAALQDATAYAQTRKTFGKPICEHQAIQLKLGEMATRAEAARLLVESAAKAYDRGERCDMEAGMAKYFATEAAMDNALECMRIHGGYGYSTEYNVERYYRDAPLLLIGEGTNEMQRIIIAKQLIERNPA
jgi:alkylation response protein AidB-like acyl-CoA dehydrogenase